MRIVRLVLILAMLAVTVPGEAQQPGKVYRVGLVFTTSPVAQMMGPNPAHPLARVFLHEMRDRGYVEERNFILERRSLEGKPERGAEVVAELVRLKVDGIVTVANPMAREAKRVTTAVPIVMATSTAPVEEGLVASLARPGGNITGLTTVTGPELEGKRLELLRDVLPKLRRVAYLGTQADWEAPWGKGAQAAARALGLTLVLAEHRPNDYVGAFGLIARERPQAVMISQNPHHFAYRGPIAELAVKNRLPSMYYSRDFTEAGGLMSYGADLRDIFRRAAIYVDKILKGAKPADLPVEQPTKFELVVNLKTAKALGLTIPQSFLLRADEVIR